MEKEKIKIKFTNWDNRCGDGCCYTWGIETEINGKKLEYDQDDLIGQIESILKHLGYDVEIKH